MNDPTKSTIPIPTDLDSAAPVTADDPRLTAFALGQLDGDDAATGRGAVQAAMAGDAALQGEIDAITRLASDLTAALADEAAPIADGLSDRQRFAIRTAARRRDRPGARVVARPATWPIYGVLAAAVTAFLLFSPIVGKGVARIPALIAKVRNSGEIANLQDRSRVDDSKGYDVAVDGDGETLWGMLTQREPSDTGSTASEGAAMAPMSRQYGLDAQAPVRVPAADRAASMSAGAAAAAPVGSTGDSGSVAPPPMHDAAASTAALAPGSAYERPDGSPANLAPDLYATAVAPMRYPTAAPPESYPPANGEGYNRVVDNPFQRIADAPLSTFGIDVDTASYANVRRFLTDGQLPPPDAVRIEELVNYFPYAYDPPSARDEMPFAVDVAAHPAPWAPEHRLVRIALKGRVVDVDRRPSANLVFLIDVSGSMDEPNKLPLVQQAMSAMVENLRRDDRVAIVTYAGSAGVALDSTPGSERGAILDGIARLTAGGSTNGAAGILTAYEIARQHFVEGGVNRVILATDGDFNVGVTGDSQLIDVITSEAKTGVFLTALGFGTGNLQDGKLEQLADKGNGHYAYIDSEREAKKTLVDELDGTLVTIAKDVKIQVEFNPAAVAGYRQIGYENRAMAAEDFADDTKDGGEIGAGHTVTALYEVVPAGQPLPTESDWTLRYQPTTDADARGGRAAKADAELLVVKLRWKAPDGTVSTERDVPFVDRGEGLRGADPDWRFAASVAAFGMLLRGSPYRGDADWGMILDLAQGGLGRDEGGWRHEFLTLVQHARTLAGGDR
ncbi:MAG: von Willebrand factor type A domain-containing protein [Ardenticatenales bacterium]